MATYVLNGQHAADTAAAAGQPSIKSMPTEAARGRTPKPRSDGPDHPPPEAVLLITILASPPTQASAADCPGLGPVRRFFSPFTMLNSGEPSEIEML